METVDEILASVGKVCNYPAHYVNGEFDFVGRPDFDAGSDFARCRNCNVWGTCYEVTIHHIPSSDYDICNICEGCIYSAEYGDNE